MGGKDLASSAMWTWSFCQAVLHAWENRGAADVNEHQAPDEPANSLADLSQDDPIIVGEQIVIHDINSDMEQGEKWICMNMHTVTLAVPKALY